MKKDQTKSQVKEMKGKVIDIPGKVAGIREPAHEGMMQNTHANIEEAFADLQNEYKKAGLDT